MADDDKTPTPPRRAATAPAPAVAAQSKPAPRDPVALLTSLYHECGSHGVGVLRMKIAEVIGALGGKAA